MTSEEFAEFVGDTTSKAINHPKKKTRNFNVKLLAAMALAIIFERENWSSACPNCGCIDHDIDYPAKKPNQYMEDTLVEPEVELKEPNVPPVTINEQAHGNDHVEPMLCPCVSQPAYLPDEPVPEPAPERHWHTTAEQAIGG